MLPILTKSTLTKIILLSVQKHREASVQVHHHAIPVFSILAWPRPSPYITISLPNQHPNPINLPASASLPTRSTSPALVNPQNKHYPLTHPSRPQNQHLHPSSQPHHYIGPQHQRGTRPCHTTHRLPQHTHWPALFMRQVLRNIRWRHEWASGWSSDSAARLLKAGKLSCYFSFLPRIKLSSC